ncbi:MAG TPA: peptidoglycan-binding domain-containing protein [Opitutaceae bacterium]|nr:peptidoglycan-binding domain-containing protein [Opitutaceae bacterium]
MKTQNKLSVPTMVCLVGAMLLAGCQNMQTGQSMSSNQNLATANAEPERRISDDSLVPPDAKPGECYARVILPPVYDTVTEQVLDKEASQEIEIIPAEYEEVEERVVVKEATERLEIIPAVYRTETEQVLVRPASTKRLSVPPVYRTVSETVMVKPAHTEWKKGKDPLQQLEGATGEIMCLVTVPAEYETVEKQVLVEPAKTVEETIPAEYRTVERQVLVSGPRTEKIVIPAEYGTVTSTRVRTPEQKRVTPVPAVYKTITKTVIKQPSRTGWKRILCETNVTPSVIGELQAKLTEAGYDASPVNGIMNSKTMDALAAYQEAHNLATGGLTYETVEALGLRF